MGVTVRGYYNSPGIRTRESEKIKRTEKMGESLTLPVRLDLHRPPAPFLSKARLMPMHPLNAVL